MDTLIPENKFFVRQIEDSSLPLFLHVVGTSFTPCVNNDGTHGNKHIYIYSEISQLSDGEKSSLEKHYKEISTEDLYKLLLDTYINK